MSNSGTRYGHSIDGWRTKKARVTLTLSPSIIAEIDRRARSGGTTRSTAADRALRDALMPDDGQMIDEIHERLAPALKLKAKRGNARGRSKPR